LSFRRQKKNVDTATQCLPQNRAMLRPLPCCCPINSRHRSAVNDCLLMADSMTVTQPKRKMGLMER